ncbi:hypothetical protein [Halorubrum tropicale]|uniref:hypothetical protein n=1 Tax=Halorubrum tropicale TaxID=1765655 RepID=UPI000AB9D4D3|nr:hypothetical protein [Halorubrum tropicale]
MSAFEISLAHADDQEGDAGEDDVEAIADEDELTLRASEDAWVSAENPVEVTQ